MTTVLRILATVLALAMMIPAFASDSEGGGGGGGGKSVAPQDFGLIFDIEGFAEIKPPMKEPLKLEREKHLLHVVNYGDKLRVVREGKIAIFSIWDKKIYEIPENTLVQVLSSGLSTIRGGRIREMPALYDPQKVPERVLDMFTTHLLPEHSCLRVASPVNTSVETLTPTLEWNNSCEGVKKVTVKILKDKAVIYQTETGEQSFRVPKELLEHESTYSWLIDGGDNGIVGETFTTLSNNQIVDYLEKKLYYSKNDQDNSVRLSFIIYLLNNNLNELARKEIVRLREEYPEITGVQVVGESTSTEEGSGTPEEDSGENTGTGE